jgi:hypothetical protein
MIWCMRIRTERMHISFERFKSFKPKFLSPTPLTSPTEHRTNTEPNKHWTEPISSHLSEWRISYTIVTIPSPRKSTRLQHQTMRHLSRMTVQFASSLCEFMLRSSPVGTSSISTVLNRGSRPPLPEQNNARTAAPR